ncbi:uncharacterized protein LOC26528962 [Drosophila willistoni]|uniref:uncharacterized protein LOC124461324 n=1 Tax=Drosophila willistoni TaxID=7260 RepID=UPI001F080FCB|nr:uncharacterized protein LOC124461324 [Drosophila willistoni]XP_046868811.1 uncharacterized protein LOC124461325 [Drosophila willistoni]XP_046869102.1 uncharacterized protein LOC124461642 [Drosophila willistoni]XP_046869103.1 uncharacterized protein LOC26529965 [Drosophila willistoni]XP_046869107.1 uncharacterized protein LOC26528962 [Drosophila willistoni]
MFINVLFVFSSFVFIAEFEQETVVEFWLISPKYCVEGTRGKCQSASLLKVDAYWIGVSLVLAILGVVSAGTFHTGDLTMAVVPCMSERLAFVALCRGQAPVEFFNSHLVRHCG